MIKHTSAVGYGMTQGGAGVAVVSGLTLNEVGVIVGICVGVLGLVVQTWGTVRRDRREEEHTKSDSQYLKQIGDSLDIKNDQDPES